jgi:hypothetical protein
MFLENQLTAILLAIISLTSAYILADSRDHVDPYQGVGVKFCLLIACTLKL